MKKWMIHNFSQMSLPFIISVIVIFFNRAVDPLSVLITAIAGNLLPDIDHLNMWREYKFKSFRAFLNFCITTDRYRRSFLLFHNVGAIIFLTALLPFASMYNFFIGIFVLSFLCHLFLDFFDDKIKMGRVVQWRYRRRT